MVTLPVFWGDWTDNISETVQDRHSSNGRQLGNHMRPLESFEWHQHSNELE